MGTVKADKIKAKLMPGMDINENPHPYKTGSMPHENRKRITVRLI